MISLKLNKVLGETFKTLNSFRNMNNHCLLVFFEVISKIVGLIYHTSFFMGLNSEIAAISHIVFVVNIRSRVIFFLAPKSIKTRELLK